MSPTFRETARRVTGGRSTRAMAVVRSTGGRVSRLATGAAGRANAALPRRGYVPGLLSIVVPCYDVETYLDECLISLRFQTYRNVEIVVVDDGSPDRSAEIPRAHRRAGPAGPAGAPPQRRSQRGEEHRGGACPRRVLDIRRLRRRRAAGRLLAGRGVAARVRGRLGGEELRPAGRRPPQAGRPAHPAGPRGPASRGDGGG